MNRVEYWYGRMSPCAVCPTGTQGCGATTASIGIASPSGTYQSVSLTQPDPTVSLTGSNNAINVNATPITLGRTLTYSPPTALCREQPFKLTVAASGNGLTYQWRKDGIPMDGETATTLTRFVQPYSSGVYDVVVTGACKP